MTFRPERRSRTLGVSARPRFLKALLVLSYSLDAGEIAAALWLAWTMWKVFFKTQVDSVSSVLWFIVVEWTHRSVRERQREINSTSYWLLQSKNEHLVCAYVSTYTPWCCDYSRCFWIPPPLVGLTADAQYLHDMPNLQSRHLAHYTSLIRP